MNGNLNDDIFNSDGVSSSSSDSCLNSQPQFPPAADKKSMFAKAKQIDYKLLSHPLCTINLPESVSLAVLLSSQQLITIKHPIID